MIKDSLLAEYDHEVATTRKLLERLPDAGLAWKPHAKSMSIGGLASHLATLPLWTGNVLNEAFFDLETATRSAEKTSRADFLATFDENSARARRWMDKTDAEYVARWALRRAMLRSACAKLRPSSAVGPSARLPTTSASGLGRSWLPMRKTSQKPRPWSTACCSTLSVSKPCRAPSKRSPLSPILSVR